MGNILSFPARTKEQISRFIREESNEGRCVLCGTQVGIQNDAPFVICEQCREIRSTVRCVRCGEVHTVIGRAWEIHEEIDPYESILNLNESGPIGMVVGACRRCDPDQELKDIPFTKLKKT